MRFSTVEEVKKWLRGLPLLRKELTMKSDFYQDLIRDSAKMGTVGEKYIHYYQTQIDEIHQKLNPAHLYPELRRPAVSGAFDAGGAEHPDGALRQPALLGRN